jgi:hypothetical protein
MSGLKIANFVDTVLQNLLHRDLIVKCNEHLLWLIHNSFYSIKQKTVDEHLWKQSVKFEDNISILNPLCLHLILT